MKGSYKKILFSLFVFCSMFLCVNAKTVNSADVPNATYVIGTHMLTRETNESAGYEGKLTTKVIMLASKTVEGDTLDDMIIYYKNPRGVWTDGLSGSSIDVPETFEIEYKNLSEFIDVPKTPTLSNVSEPKDRGFVSYSDGKYLYDLGFNLKDYQDENDGYTAVGYEIYDEEGTVVSQGTLGGIAPVEVEIGTKKTFKARFYNLDSKGNKVYSEYSNELEFDKTKLAKPTLINANAETTPPFFSYENGVYKYGISFNDDVYAYESEIPSSPYVSVVAGYEVYSVDNGEYTKVKEVSYNPNMGSIETVDVEDGTRKAFVMRVYALNSSSEKVYSDYSDELVFDKTKVDTPKLNMRLSGFENGVFNYVPEFNQDDYYYQNNPVADGAELYEKTGDSNYDITNPVYVWDLTPDAGSYSAYMTVEVGTSKSFAMRVYKLDSEGNKVYSDYSDDIIIDRKVETPELYNSSRPELNDGKEYMVYDNGDFIYSLGVQSYPYIYGTNIDDIYAAGYKVYKKGSDQVVAQSTVGGAAEVRVADGTSETFVAKVYALNSKGEEVYSDYSNELVFDHTKPMTPVITSEFAGTCSTIDCGTGYSLKIDRAKYDYSDDASLIDGYEVYTVADGNYTKLESDEYDVNNNGDPVVTVGYYETKSFAMRVYKTVGEEKEYSDYSNVLELSGGFITTKLEISSGASGCYTDPDTEENVCDMGVAFNHGSFELDDGNGNQVPTLDGYELYYFEDGKYVKFDDRAYDPATSNETENLPNVTVGNKEFKVVAMRLYKTVDGNKVYTNYSNKLVVRGDKVLDAPVIEEEFLGATSGPEGGTTGFAVMFNYSDYENVTISGLELYEATDDGYAFLEDKAYDTVVTSDPRTFPSVMIVGNESKTVVMRLYSIVDGEKVYSPYSNELKLGN